MIVGSCSPSFVFSLHPWAPSPLFFISSRSLSLSPSLFFSTLHLLLLLPHHQSQCLDGTLNFSHPFPSRSFPSLPFVSSLSCLRPPNSPLLFSVITLLPSRSRPQPFILYLIISTPEHSHITKLSQFPVQCL